jgi:hypothetical protein
MLLNFLYPSPHRAPYLLFRVLFVKLAEVKYPKFKALTREYVITEIRQSYAKGKCLI